MKINSIRFKTSILFSGVLCIILLINSGAIYLTLKHILYRDLDSELKIKVEQVSGILNAYAEVKRVDNHPFTLMRRLLTDSGFEPDNRTIIDKLWKTDVETLNLKEDYFRIINTKGQVILTSSNLDRERNVLLSKEIPVSFKNLYFKIIKTRKVSGRAINFPFLYQERLPLVIQLVAPTKALHKILGELALFMVLSIIFIVLLASSFGRYLTKSILKPVASVTATANDISHTDLSTRIEEKEIDSEMKELIRSFNSMIKRLEASFAHINEFSSHVAHELKTPLSIIRGEIELALTDENSNKEDYKRVLEGSLEEIDHLIRIIKDLLLLAKLDYKPEIYKFEKINFLRFMKDLFGQSAILATEKRIDMSFSKPQGAIMIEADEVHLRRMFLNLINNAVKFTSKNGKIKIIVEKDAKEARVLIQDSGEGIAESDLEKIFTKFYRVRKGAAVEQPGNGLGLPIARAIVKAHKGEIQVKSKLNKGSTFIVTLPIIAK